MKTKKLYMILMHCWMLLFLLYSWSPENGWTFTSVYFVSSENNFEEDNKKIDKVNFVFKESCCLWVSSPRIWNVFWMRIGLKNLLHQLKTRRDDPEITKKLLFCFIFGLKICWVQTYGSVRWITLKTNHVWACR